ncbi:MAG: FAD-dependent oxidoreductase [Anaerolineales bacterium]|jgi:nitrite reductase (NADH) large subunit
MGKKIVIIGAGPAGVRTAETVREHDREVDLVMITSEPYPPYSPPAMVDHFITGSRAHLWRGEDWPERMGVDYHSGISVTGIDPDAHRLHLAEGNSIDYDQLVIATGSRLYAPLPGADLPGVYNFKSLTAANELIQRVKGGEARTAVIVGAGFIGMEIALLLRELGVEVTQVEMLDQVMSAMLTPETAAYALEIMQARGINVHLNTKAETFVGNGRAKGVRLDSGDILSGDIYIAATGVRPNLELLEGSGISHRWGITVDEHLRTNAPDIYAAGDVVETEDRLTGESYVHAIFPNAVEQGRVVGLNLLGYEQSYEGADRMNSLKHLGLPIMAAGLKKGDEVLNTRRNGGLRTLFLKENRLVGFQLVGDIRSAGVFRALINRRKDVRKIKNQLLDPNFGQGTLIWQSIMPYA